MKIITHIIIFLCSALLFSCSGSRKYFKAAEKLEKQGLVNEAAQFYLEALQRKPTNTDARIKLREVGQKHVSHLSSEFFRYYNTQQNEMSIETFERLKDFTGKCKALNVLMDYPRGYDEDYQKSIDQYLVKNYNLAHLMVNQKRYNDALPYIRKIDKYNSSYKNTRQLDVVATCEPLYQSAISSLETKNYASALRLLSDIKNKSENYKDSRDLLELASAQQTKAFILFEPKPAITEQEKRIQQYLFDNFSAVAQKDFSSVRIINNTPFQNAPAGTDLNNSNNIDLIQAIRKATGADYFYVFDISNSREFNSGISKTASKGYQEIVTRVNDSTSKTEYKPFDYNIVKASRIYSYDFKYKVINAYSNQIVNSQSQQIKASDAVEYNEFQKRFTGNINSLFPYNPPGTPPLGRYSPKQFRSNFSARNDLKSFEDLRTDVLNQTIRLFSNSASAMK